MARRFHRARHHVRHHGSRALAGWKGTAASAAAGVGTGIALPYVTSSVPMLQSAGWWAMPGALILMGHFLKRKNAAIGGALLGIGGMSLYSAFQGSRATAKGYPSGAYADAGGPLTSYSDNIRTDAAPSLGTAQAAALLNANPQSTMGLVDAGYAEAGADDAYGLQD